MNLEMLLFLELKEAYQESFDHYRRMRKQVLDIKKNQEEQQSPN